MLGTMSEQRRRRTGYRKLAIAVASVAVGLCQFARGWVAIDLRASSATGSAVIVNPQEVSGARVGDRITVDLVAHISDTDNDPSNDGFISGIGSIVSSGDPYFNALGTLRGSNVSPFDGAGSSRGLQVDLDGDGDLDVGGTDPNESAHYFAVRASTAPQAVLGNGLVIGTATFDVTGVTSAIAQTTLRFLPRSSGSFLWQEQGVFKAWPQGTGIHAGDVYWGQSVDVVQVTPEPTAVAMLGAVATFASALRPRRRDH